MADIFLRTKIGEFVLDAEISEAHTSDLRITDNPVESGAEVSDHAVLEPKTFRIDGIIVDYEPSNAGLPLEDQFDLRGGIGFLDLLPMATDFTSITEQAAGYAERALSSYAPGFVQLGKQARELAPWLLGPASGANDQTSSGSRLQQLYESLLALQKSGETIDIQTGIRLYKSMLLPSISGTETQRGSLQVSITARELIVVETKSISGVSVPAAGANKSGRAGAQSAAKSSKGNTNPAETNKSALSTIGGLLQ